MFKNFTEFAKWCKETKEIDVEYNKQEENIKIYNIKDTNGMYVCETMIYAYDSGFRFGAMSAMDDNGLLIIENNENKESNS